MWTKIKCTLHTKFGVNPFTTFGQVVRIHVLCIQRMGNNLTQQLLTLFLLSVNKGTDTATKETILLVNRHVAKLWVVIFRLILTLSIILDLHTKQEIASSETIHVIVSPQFVRREKVMFTCLKISHTCLTQTCVVWFPPYHFLCSGWVDISC
jgi:hypothetical protein